MFIFLQCFFAKLVLTKRGTPPKVIFQLDVVHNLPTKLAQKLLDENLLDEKLFLFSI
jgi:hypothetical protein